MLVCARLRHVAGSQWGNKKYMNMKHLEAAIEDASIAGRLHSCQSLQTKVRKNLDTTVGAGAAGNTLSFVLSTGKEESLETKWFQGFPLIGGDKRDRTADLLNAIQALSQLSYTPVYASSKFLSRRKIVRVELTRKQC